MPMRLPPDLEADIRSRGTMGPPVNIPENTDASPPAPTHGGEAGPGKAAEPQFVLQCRALGLPEPVMEHRFDDARRWRFDAAWPEHKVALEQQGGLFSGGRHVRGAALLREYEKLNAAALQGWTVLLFSPRQVESGECFPILKAALEAK